MNVLLYCSYIHVTYIYCSYMKLHIHCSTQCGINILETQEWESNLLWWSRQVRRLWRGIMGKQTTTDDGVKEDLGRQRIIDTLDTDWWWCGGNIFSLQTLHIQYLDMDDQLFWFISLFITYTWIVLNNVCEYRIPFINFRFSNVFKSVWCISTCFMYFHQLVFQTGFLQNTTLLSE